MSGLLIQGAARGGPHEGDDALGDHGTVEHEVTLALTLEAAGHQRGLGGMEAGNRAAGHGDEHEGPDGQSLRVQVTQRDLRDRIAARYDPAEDTRRHDDQHRAEHRVELADDLVYGQQRGQHIVNEDDNDPEARAQHIRRQPRQQRRGGGDKDRAGQQQEQHGEDAHHPPGAFSEIDAAELRDGGAVMALGDHAGHIVVYAAAQHRAENDPQEHHRAEAGAHERAEDRAGAGDVQKLHQEGLPGGHGEKIHVVAAGVGRGLPVVGGERFFHDPAIDKIAEHQHGEG